MKITTQTPRISAIAAIGTNRELGCNNELIWRIPTDLQRVKQLTTGHPIIMGRKTYESIGRPLPQRTNIVISRNADYTAPGCIVVTSLPNALAAARKVEAEEIFIFGGAAVYELAWPHITRLYLTVIAEEAPAADTYFPDFSADFSEVEKSETHWYEDIAYQWVTLDRR